MEPQDIRLDTKFKRVDVRRDKEYAKVCEIVAYVPEIETPHRGHLLDFYPIHYFREQLEPRLIEAQVESTYNNSWRISLKSRIDAKKPSQIADDDKARKLLPDETKIRGAISVAYRATEHEASQISGKYHRWHRTMQLLDWFCTEITKQAKKNMRFEQRLKALSAEYQAEIASIFDEQLEQAKKIAEEDDAGRFCELSIIYLEKYAEEYVKQHMGNGLPGPFPRSVSEDREIKWIKDKVEPSDKDAS